MRPSYLLNALQDEDGDEAHEFLVEDEDTLPFCPRLSHVRRAS